MKSPSVRTRKCLSNMMQRKRWSSALFAETGVSNSNCFSTRFFTPLQVGDERCQIEPVTGREEGFTALRSTGCTPSVSGFIVLLHLSVATGWAGDTSPGLLHMERRGNRKCLTLSRIYLEDCSSSHLREELREVSTTHTLVITARRTLMSRQGSVNDCLTEH